MPQNSYKYDMHIFSSFELLLLFLNITIKMYPIYIQSNQLSLDDYLQVQALLSQRKHLEEQRRIQKASHRLQVLTELYRRRELEDRAIEAYYQKKRQQEWMAHQRQQLEEQRQLQQYYAALQEQQQMQDQYLLWVSQKSAPEACCQPELAVAVEEHAEESESEAEDEESHRDQLAHLIKLIFGVPESHEGPERQDESEYQEEEDRYEEEEVEDEQKPEENEPMTIDVDTTMEDQDENNEDEGILLAMKHIDENESMDEDFIHVPSLVNKTQDIENLVDEILTSTENDNEQTFTSFDEEDPVKIAKYDALERIEQELNEIQNQDEDHVLHVTLDLSERAASPDTIITATTAENREFLSYEDRIVNLILKLDTIDADGDDHIRNERKLLVKKAEEMLSKLDDIKLKEWSKLEHHD